MATPVTVEIPTVTVETPAPPAVTTPAMYPTPPAAVTPTPVPVYVPSPETPGMAAPMGVQLPIGVGRPWSSGLFECFSDPMICCLTCWCPCITSGRITDIVDEGRTFTCPMGGLIWCAMAAVGLNTCYSCIWRTKYREKYGVTPERDAFFDFIVHFCCECCAMIQEYKDLQSMGYDPALGWEAVQANVMATPPQQVMVSV